MNVYDDQNVWNNSAFQHRAVLFLVVECLCVCVCCVHSPLVLFWEQEYQVSRVSAQCVLAASSMFFCCRSRAEPCQSNVIHPPRSPCVCVCECLCVCVRVYYDPHMGIAARLWLWTSGWRAPLYFGYRLTAHVSFTRASHKQTATAA